MDKEIKIAIIVIVVVLALALALGLEILKANRKGKGQRIRAFLRAWSLPSNLKGLIYAVIAIVGFLIINALAGPLPALIAVAIIIGLLNGFYTQRKPRP